MCFRKTRPSITGRIFLAIVMAVTGAATLVGCRQQARESGDRGGFAVRDASDCLPDITLIDQHGRKVSLASLKGKPALFDFIYTTCPGPCLILTARMRKIAEQLGPRLATDVRIVSLTVDPQHDHASQLLAYARRWHADVNGWLFLTGTPKQIDDVMARFKLVRHREPDGTIDHVLEFFLVGANGRALLQYLGERADPKVVAGDIERAAAGQAVAAGRGSDGGARL
jgi:protein SCO1